MTEAGFPVEMAGGVPVVVAPEEIDITSANDLRTALADAAARGRNTFVVDLSLTRFCDSSGLRALVAAHRRAQAEGGEMLLVVPDTAVLRVLAITGMDQEIPNFASLDEALTQASTAPPADTGSADTRPADTRPADTGAADTRPADTPFLSPSLEATFAHTSLPDHHLRPTRTGCQGGIREL